jgi:hypothetical protein
MIILTPIERETIQVPFKESPPAELPWIAPRKQQNHRCCGSGLVLTIYTSTYIMKQFTCIIEKESFERVGTEFFDTLL